VRMEVGFFNSVALILLVRALGIRWLVPIKEGTRSGLVNCGRGEVEKRGRNLLGFNRFISIEQ
jgi:hypothetical protein